jgi:hypothetical protein
MPDMLQTLQWQRHRERHSVMAAPAGRWLDEPNDAPKPPNQAFSRWNDHRGGWVILVVMQ